MPFVLINGDRFYWFVANWNSMSWGRVGFNLMIGVETQKNRGLGSNPTTTKMAFSGI